MEEFLTNKSLYEQWLDAKEVEIKAVEARRVVEDKLLSIYGIAEGSEGSRTIKEDGYKVVVTSRVTRNVDTDKVQQIALEQGLTSHIQFLFRWKAEINAKIWKNTAESITSPFIEAITAKPGRPSFTIQKENEDAI